MLFFKKKSKDKDSQYIFRYYPDPVSDDEKVMELTTRTPSYCGWQQEHWVACCDDYCAFVDMN